MTPNNLVKNLYSFTQIPSKNYAFKKTHERSVCDIGWQTINQKSVIWQVACISGSGDVPEPTTGGEMKG